MPKCPQCGSENKDRARFCNDCGKMLTDELKGNGTLGKGRIIGPYHILEAVSFEMGEVLYKVEDKINNSYKFVKEIITIMPEENIKIKTIERFNKEIELLTRISSPHLPRITDSFTEQGSYYLACYIVFEYVQGECLSEIIKEKKISEKFILNMGKKICNLLDTLHKCRPPVYCYNLCHSNIIVKNDENILLTDIPITRTLNGKNIFPQNVQFIAPERYQGQVKETSDIYSLGALLHYLLTGVHSAPFIFKPLRSAKPELPIELEDLISKALRLKQEKRFQSAEEMKKALEQIKGPIKNKNLLLKSVEKKPDYTPPFKPVEKISDYNYPIKPVEKKLEVKKAASSIIKKDKAIKEDKVIPEKHLDNKMIKWYSQTGDKISSSPLLVGNTIYIGSDDKKVYAVNLKTGKEKWNFKTGSWVSTTPDFYNDKIYIGSRDGKLYCLNSFNGRVEWELHKEESIFFNPAVSEGNLLIGASLYRGGIYEEAILNLDANTGEELWHYNTGGYIYGKPFIDNDIVYIGSEQGVVSALDINTGKKLWNYEIGGRIYSSIIVSEDIVYIAGEGVFKNGTIHLLNADDGRFIWQLDFDKSFRTSVTLGEDIIYATSIDNKIYAIDLNIKEIVWEFETKDSIRCNPLLDKGIIYTGSDDGYLYAIDATTGKKLWDFKTGGAIRSTPSISKGSLIFGSRDGKIYCLDINLPGTEVKVNSGDKKSSEEDIPKLYKKSKKFKDENKLEEAIETYLKILKIDNSDLLSLIDLADIYFTLSDWDNSLKYYEKIPVKSLNNDSLIRFGQLLLQNNKYSHAAEILEKVENPDISVIMSTGEAFRENGDFDKAIGILEHASQKSNDPEIYVNLGKVFSRKGDFDSAYLAYDMALEIDENSINGYLGKIQLKIIERKWKEAEEIIEAAEKVTTDPDLLQKLSGRKGKIYLELGNSHLENNEFATATNFFEKAEKLPLTEKQMENLKKSKANVFLKLDKFT